MVVGDDVYDAVVGYRMWQAEAHAGHVRLHSPNRTFEWRKDHVRAECLCPGGWGMLKEIFRPTIASLGAIDSRDGHACGIYAWSRPVVSESIRYTRTTNGQPRYVFGEVALWGVVHVHEQGYRAEFARPIAFYVTPTMDDLTRQFVGLAAIQWGVPTVIPERDWEIGYRTDDEPIPSMRVGWA